MADKRSFWKIIFAVFIIQMLLTVSFIKISAADTAPNKGTPDLMSQLKVEGKEVIESRTEHTKLFRKNGKTRTVLVSLAPLHYKDKKGKWQEIETALEDSKNDVDEDGKAFGFRSLKNSFQSYLPKYSNGWVQVRSGKYQVAFKLMGVQGRDFNRDSDNI